MTGPRLPWQGGVLEVRTRRQGLRTVATLLRDSVPVGEETGLGRVLLTLPGSDEPSPTVLVLAPVPGAVWQAVLLVPRPPGDDDPAGTDDADGPATADDADGPATADDDLPPGARTALDLATAERHRFDPVPGTLAARLRALEERHPRLWASRHVLAAVAKVAGALLGFAVLLQALVQPLIAWVLGLLPRVDLPDIPWPDLDLPSIPLPDVDLPDLPDVSLPGWLVAVLATAEYWGPVLVAVGLAVREVRRKRRGTRAGAEEPATAGGDGADAHR